MPQLAPNVDINQHPLLRKLSSKGVSILQIRKSCLKLKNEIENLHGFSWKTGALRTAPIKQDKCPGSEYPVWW
jgi:hypothetical protein